MSANQIAASKASPGIFINLSLTIYTIGVLYRFAAKFDTFADQITPEITKGFRVVMFLGGLFLLIGLSRTVGQQYDLTRFFILALMIAMNVYMDEIWVQIMSPKKSKKIERILKSKGGKKKNDE